MFSVVFQDVERFIRAERDEIVVLAPENLLGINFDSSDKRLVFPAVEGERVAAADAQNWTGENLVGAELRLEGFRVFGLVHVVDFDGLGGLAHREFSRVVGPDKFQRTSKGLKEMIEKGGIERLTLFLRAMDV